MPTGRSALGRAPAARWELMSQNEVLAAMHEHSPDHACGENELQIPDFASYQWEWMAHVPRFRDRYYADDQTPHYRYMRDVLALVATSSRARSAGCSSRTSTANNSVRSSRPIPTQRS